MKRLGKLFLATAVLLLIGGVVVIHRGSAGAAFTANNIIDDGVFNNTSSMSPAQIDNWLNNLPSSCISSNNGFASADPTGYNPTQGFIYGGPVSAGRVIYDAAQAYGINPQVLLATLQKEEALVTGASGCSTWQYASAMGFSCTDAQHLHSYPADGALLTPLYYKNGTAVTSISNTCVGNFDGSAGPQYAGFSEQVIWATWLLEKGLQRSEGNVNWAVIKPNWDNSDESNCYSGPMTQGNFKRCRADSSPTFYDGYVVIDGQSVHMDTGATATLYWYTPHFSGNQSFYNLFTSWFGSTTYKEPVGGTLYNLDGQVYLATTDNNTIYKITGPSMLKNYGLDNYQIIPASATIISQYTDGGALNSLLYDNGNIFLVNDGARYYIPGPSICIAWGFDCGTSQELGESFQQSALKSGAINLNVLGAYNTTVYKMSGGQRQPIANPTTLSALGYSFNQVVGLNSVNLTQPLGPLLITTPATIKFSGSSAIYYFDGSIYHPLQTPSIQSAWNMTNVLTPTASSYDSSPPPLGPPMTKWFQDSSSNKYLIDAGRRLLLSTDQQQLWPSAIYQTFGAEAAQKLASSNLSNFIWTNPDIYVLNGGQKHHVPTSDDSLALGINKNNTTIVSSGAVSDVPAGTDSFGNGKLLNLGGTAIYVVNNHKLLYIPSPGAFSAFNFNWGKIYSYGTSIKNDYPIDSGDISKTLTSDWMYNILIGSRRLKLNGPMASDYGLLTSGFTPLDSRVSANISGGSLLSRFLYNNDDGRIYYASGGALHYVQSYSSFVAYGGLSTPATTVDSDFISNFVIGQNI